MTKKEKEIFRKLCVCFPDSHIVLRSELKIYRPDNKPIQVLSVYIESHKFKMSKSAWFNDCDSEEELIAHINYEMEGIPKWVPVKQLIKKNLYIAQ